MLNAVIQVSDPEMEPEDPAGFNAGGVCVYIEKALVKEVNGYRAELSRHSGTIIPPIRLGEIDDSGHVVVGEVRELCAAVGLNPDDSAHYHEVLMAVRSASLCLARKIAEGARK